jgi:hypothetical protein
MKKIIVVLLAISFFVTSCYEDQMDYAPTDLVTPDKVFSTEEGAEAALIGVYSRFSPGWYYYPIVFLEAYGNKDWYPGANQGALLALYETHITTSADNYKGYKRLWSTITFANAFLKNLADFETPFVNPERKEQAIAEARFLRAYIYFELVQIWGPVPLITDEKDYGILYPSNSTIPEIYTQIIADLEYGIEKLPVVGTVEAGRATKGAAQGILAKVLMTQKDEKQMQQPSDAELQRAVDLTGEVMKQYSLVDTYDDLWQREKFNNSEQIFSVASSNLGNGNGIHWPQYASHDYEPTQRFFDSFDDKVEVDGKVYTDVRRKSTIYVDRMSKKLRDNKYRRAGKAPGGPNQTTANLYVLRLSDIILLRAEALNKLDFGKNKSEIINLINRVRNRAGAVPATEADCTDQQSTALVIEEERHKEFFFEFQSFFDLKRNNRLIEVLGKNGVDLGFDNEYQRLWAIPESEINKNDNLKQNPGY